MKKLVKLVALFAIIFISNAANFDISLLDGIKSTELISYIQATNAIESNTESAINFISQKPNSFFTESIKHKLLTVFYEEQDYINYSKIYNLTEKTTKDEDCGYNVSAFVLGKSTTVNYKQLLSNKLTQKCIDLIAIEMNQNLESQYKDIFAYNLISNQQISSFNKIYNKNLKKDNDKYTRFYENIKLANNDIELAYIKVLTINDKITQDYLYNYIAKKAALSFNYKLAKNAIQKGNVDFLSDSQFEWRVRTYLALSDWKNVIDSIGIMPKRLSNKSAWQYWLLYTKQQLGQEQKTNHILPNFDYYSLLVNRIPKFTKKTNESEMSLNKDVELSLGLYQLASNTKNNDIMQIAYSKILFEINHATESELLSIAYKADGLEWYSVSIYAATRLNNHIINLEYPTPYLSKYESGNIAQLLATTRQESRFNKSVIAKDGGVGLMQIMPNTSLEIAEKLHEPNCYMDYVCNIRFGNWYLQDINKKLNNIIYSIAAYNAGTARVKKWQSALNKYNIALQIELFPIDTTRDYVQKVIANKLIYNYILNNTDINLLEYLKNPT